MQQGDVAVGNTGQLGDVDTVREGAILNVLEYDQGTVRVRKNMALSGINMCLFDSSAPP